MCRILLFQGLLGISVPAEVGGIGGTFKDEAIVIEEMGYAHCYSPNLIGKERERHLQ